MFVVAMDNTHHNYKVLSWNVRGMNNPARQEDLRQITAQFSPDIVFI
jgi:exonuclease III